MRLLLLRYFDSSLFEAPFASHPVNSYVDINQRDNYNK